jgi:predicted alpha-1,2-mannosidase
VLLVEDNIKAELTATIHTGIHRYSFGKEEEPSLFICEGNRRGTSGMTFRLLNDKHAEGKAGNIHFVMHFSIPVKEVKIWNGKELLSDSQIENADNGGALCIFGDGTDQIEVRTGVSIVSAEGALANLQTESAGKRFNKLRKESEERWNDHLSVVRVKSANEDDKKIFYTALYHSCFMPFIQSDSDGKYTGFDHEVHEAEGYKYYDGYAFWDSFRTKYPLYSLLYPSVYTDILSSLRDIYMQADNWGSLPGSDHPPHGVIYKAGGKDGYQRFGSCRHEHMLMVMADGYFKGLTSFGIMDVYPFMKKELLLQMPVEYDTIGFIPARPDQTGEYSWDNYIMLKIAEKNGVNGDTDWLRKRSEYWRNTWDSSIKYFRARAADGTWLDFPDDPAINREKYTYEGSKWHWRWNVVHDIPSLINEFGGKEEFVGQLNYFFENDLYTAGNQIDLHAPFLFNMAGEPWLTQKWVRSLLTKPVVQKYGTHGFFAEPVFDRIYKTTPDGYLREMDDDYGCMAAWYAMSAMGLYQVCPGVPDYQITTPLFDEVIIKLDKRKYSGKSFIIRTEGLSDTSFYIRSATLRGEALKELQISHEDIARGGELVLKTGGTPFSGW